MIPVQVSGLWMRPGRPVAVPHGPAYGRSMPCAVAVGPAGNDLWVADGGSFVSGHRLTDRLHPALVRTFTGGYDPRWITFP